MKKIILILVFIIAGFSAFSQSGIKQPNYTTTPSKFKPGNWHMLGAWDSINACYADTLGYYVEGDTVKIWSNKVLWINGQIIFPDYWKLTGDKLEPKISTNYINTDSSYYIKGFNLIRYFPTPYYSIAMGEDAMINDSVGNNNIAIGWGSMHDNATGYNNNAFGYSTLNKNKTGYNNTAIGYLSLMTNKSGNNNTAIGAFSNEYNTTGESNCAFGYSSLENNTTGKYNIGVGANTLIGNITDSNNIAVGYNAGYYATMSNRLWIGAGDSNNAIIYGEMYTRPRIRINGELNVSGDINYTSPYGSYLDTVTQTTSGGIKVITVRFIKGESDVTLIGDTSARLEKAGKYLLSGRIIIKPSANGKNFNTFLKVNGAIAPSTSTYWTSVGSASRIIPITATLSFNAGDILGLYWYTDDTSAEIVSTPKTSTMPTCAGVSITIQKISQ